MNSERRGSKCPLILFPPQCSPGTWNGKAAQRQMQLGPLWIWHAMVLRAWQVLSLTESGPCCICCCLYFFLTSPTFCCLARQAIKKQATSGPWSAGEAVCAGRRRLATALRAASPGRGFRLDWEDASQQIYFVSFIVKKQKQKYIFIDCGFSSIPPFLLACGNLW